MKKTVVTIGTAAVVIFTSTFVANPVSAERNLQDVQNERKELKSELSKAEKKVADIMQEIKEFDAEINQLETAIKENEKQVEKTEKEINKLEEEIDELQSEIDILQEEIDIRNGIIKDRIASYQANGGNISLLEIFYGVKDFNDFISRVSAVVTLTNADKELIEKNEEEKQLVVEKQSIVEDKLVEQEEAKAEIKEIIKTTELQKDELEIEKEKVKKVEKKLKKELNKLKLKDNDLARIEASLTTPSFGTSSTSGSFQTVAYSGAGGSALSVGSQFVGRSRYVYGGKNPSAGHFDCSGFVQWAYEQEGIRLPRTTRDMATVGKAIDPSEMKPGDLIFFDTVGRNSHVAIYAGNGQFLGSQNNTGVAYASLNNSYWKRTFNGHVRRIK